MVLLQLCLLLLVGFLSSLSNRKLVGIMRPKRIAILQLKKLGWSLQGWR